MQAALFSGQGAQYEKMGLSLAADPAIRALYDTASEILGFDLYKIIDESDLKTLSETRYAQPAITVTSLACLRAAQQRGYRFDGVAGHSLGEYAAMIAAGMLSLEDGFRVIKARATAMDACAKENDGAMAAVMKVSAEEIEAVCAAVEGYVVPANYNSPVQTVIAGERDAVAAASEALAAKKARVVPLAVASAFHTKLMQPAADAFYAAIREIPFKAPAVPFYSNLTGAKRTDFSDMPAALAAHIVSPVRFVQELETMQADGFDSFTEFGPKTVLSGLTKKTLKGVTVRNVENAETLDALFA